MAWHVSSHVWFLLLGVVISGYSCSLLDFDSGYKLSYSHAKYPMSSFVVPLGRSIMDSLFTHTHRRVFHSLVGIVCLSSVGMLIMLTHNKYAYFSLILLIACNFSYYLLATLLSSWFNKIPDKLLLWLFLAACFGSDYLWKHIGGLVFFGESAFGLCWLVGIGINLTIDVLFREELALFWPFDEIDKETRTVK